MKKNTKNIVFSFLVLIVIALLSTLVVFRDKQKVYNLNINNVIIQDGGVIHNIDSTINTNKMIEISGWALKTGQDIKTYNCNVVLKNTDTNKYFILPTELQVRNDVTEAFNDGFNYDFSGFKSRTYKSKLDNNVDYEICILYKNDFNDILINTKEIIRLKE